MNWRARPYAELDATSDKPLMVFPDRETWARLLQQRIDRGWCQRSEGGVERSRTVVVESLDDLPPGALPGDRKLDETYIPSVSAPLPTK